MEADCPSRNPEPPLCIGTGLRYSYGRREVLRGCDLAVHRGQVVGLSGENGSGKSTLVKCLLGFARPSAGAIAITRSVAYCPQENYLHHAYTVAEHLELVSSLRRTARAPDPAFLEHATDTLKLRGYLGYTIGTLSGGTYQKVKLLTALLHHPRLLVLDEPTDGFDWTMYLVFWDLVGELVAEGTGILMISHLLLDRDRFDRIYELAEGRLDG